MSYALSKASALRVLLYEPADGHQGDFIEPAAVLTGFHNEEGDE